MAVDILPESRPRHRTGSIPSVLGTLIPIYCANCGKPYGMVPEKMITFAFALCQPCAEMGIGDIAHLYQEPDQAFWDRCAEEQAKAKIVTVLDLQKALEDPSSQVAKLAREWQTKVRREI
jgi:hypothetical protein